MSGLRVVLACLALLATVSLAAAQEHGDSPPHWTYEGEEGPAHWGSLSDDYAACAEGSAQSPIDITSATSVNLSNIAFHYNDTFLNIVNNGHTVQLNITAGNSITYNGIRYDLLQFHFHHPSEHTVGGEAAAMELHLVHRNESSGSLAVVGVLLTAGEATNPAYATVFKYLPDAPGETVIETSAVVPLNDLLPESRTFYTYQGSLTTPPCSEIVRWLLLETPVELSEAQIESFAAIFENNARPVQPQHERDLLLDADA
jgi:carbonic anhydrase